jgi:hypothetical protein
MFPFDAAGLLAILSAVDGRDPVIRQLHELLKPRSAELPPQVPSRRSLSADRTAGAVRPVPQPAIRHEIHEAFLTSPPPSSAGDTSSADHLPGLISAQIRAPRRVNTQVNQLRAVRACEGVTSRVSGDDAPHLAPTGEWASVVDLPDKSANHERGCAETWHHAE